MRGTSDKWPDHKVCTRCKKDLPLDSFTPNKNGRFNRNSMCRPCVTLNARKWKQDNPERYKESYMRYTKRMAARQESTKKWREQNPLKPWERELKKKYGIDGDKYLEILAEQGGRCAVCQSEKPSSGEHPKRFAVDHCHRSGKVRGLLCISCNTMLGLAKDDRFTLTRAIDYLTKHQE